MLICWGQWNALFIFNFQGHCVHTVVEHGNESLLGMDFGDVKITWNILNIQILCLFYSYTVLAIGLRMFPSNDSISLLFSTQLPG